MKVEVGGRSGLAGVIGAHVVGGCLVTGTLDGRYSGTVSVGGMYIVLWWYEHGGSVGTVGITGVVIVGVGSQVVEVQIHVDVGGLKVLGGVIGAHVGVTVGVTYSGIVGTVVMIVGTVVMIVGGTGIVGTNVVIGCLVTVTLDGRYGGMVSVVGTYIVGCL
jgi:hypothetical protein